MARFVDWFRCKWYLRQLHSKYAGTREYAVFVLKEIGYKYKRGEDGYRNDGFPRVLVEAFMQRLSDPDDRVREKAAEALRYTLPIAIPALVDALSDKAPGVRIEALIALGSLDAESAVEAMAACLHDDPNEEVRHYATAALEDIHSPRVVEHLTQALDDPSAMVRSAAARSLEWKTIGIADDEPVDQSVVPALCKALGDEDSDAREAAAEALARVLDCANPDWDTAFEPLCAAARDLQADVRAAAIGALGLSRDPRAHTLVVQALDDEDPDVQGKALEALALIDPAQCLELAPGMPAVPAISLERAMEGALGRMDDPALPPKVLSYFLDDRMPWCVREGISRSIALRGDPVNTPVLLKALSTNEDCFRHSVIKALAAAPDRRALPALLDCLRHQDTHTRAEAALALAAMGDEQAIEPLAKLTEDESPAVRWRTLWALSFFDLAKVLPLLVRGLQDDDEHVQRTAVDALAGVCDADSLRRICSSLPRSQKAIRAALEDEIATLECDCHEKPSGKARSVARGTLHYE